MKLIAILAALFLLTSWTTVPSNFVWLDWDHNAPADNVQYYTLYIGDWPNPQNKIKLGYQNSIQVLRTSYHTYAAVTATNTVAESPRSNEIHYTSP